MQANAQIQSPIARSDHTPGQKAVLPVGSKEEKLPLGVCWAVCGVAAISGWFAILYLI